MKDFEAVVDTSMRSAKGSHTVAAHGMAARENVLRLCRDAEQTNLIRLHVAPRAEPHAILAMDIARVVPSGDMVEQLDERILDEFAKLGGTVAVAEDLLQGRYQRYLIELFENLDGVEVYSPASSARSVKRRW